MTGFVLGFAAGVIGGTGSSVWFAARWAQKRVCPDSDAHELSDQDREDIAVEFATHASAVRRQVSEYAELLAGGDAALRDRLRTFEQGGE